MKLRIVVVSSLVCLFQASFVHANDLANCTGFLASIGADGQIESGSRTNLIKAAWEGAPLRVGWERASDETGAVILLHWSEARFVSVFESEVFTQVEAIHRQSPKRGKATIEFGEQPAIWHGMLDSTGTLRGRLDSSDNAGERKVRTVWCRTDVAPSKWRAVYRHDTKGERLSGDVNDLLSGIRQGHPIRVAWGLKRVRDGKTYAVEHAVEPVFVTIVNEREVVAQLPEHIAQLSYWDAAKARFEDPAVMWRGLMSTRGTFDAVWVNRATGEEVRRSPQRAALTWFVYNGGVGGGKSLAEPEGVIADTSSQ